VSKTRKMRLVAFLKTGPTAHHHGMWRHPETDNDFLDPAWYEHVARVLEKGKFDCLFFADTLGLFDNYRGNFDAILRGGGQMGFFDPLPVLAIMSRVTRHIGLGATMSSPRSATSRRATSARTSCRRATFATIAPTR
jgi:alkanesulfonate monooxygenase SsuD/methylene tetrahydromethanopterin reductase-like flavin-dependent oxidoreductase (luciferase family)